MKFKFGLFDKFQNLKVLVKIQIRKNKLRELDDGDEKYNLGILMCFVKKWFHKTNNHSIHT